MRVCACLRVRFGTRSVIHHVHACPRDLNHLCTGRAFGLGNENGSLPVCIRRRYFGVGHWTRHRSPGAASPPLQHTHARTRTGNDRRGHLRRHFEPCDAVCLLHTAPTPPYRQRQTRWQPAFQQRREVDPDEQPGPESKIQCWHGSVAAPGWGDRIAV